MTIPRLPTALLFLASTLALLPAPRTQEPEITVLAPLGTEIPALQRHSSWAQDTRYEGEAPDKRQRGVYPVGNGHVFAYMGLGRRANTMQAITGPSYQTDEAFAPRGHFGELTLELRAAGQPVDLPHQSVRRVRGAAVVVTEDRADGLSLRTLTFATPGATSDDAHHLTRVITVENRGTDPVATVHLDAHLDGAPHSTETALVSTYASEIRPATALVLLTGARPVDGALRADLGTLDPGATWTGVLTISTVAGAAPPAGWQPVPATLDRALTDAQTTLAWWRAKLAPTLEFDTDHARIRDLVHDWKVMMLVQRCARSGVVTSMVNRRGASIRDSSGPLLCFLRFHMWDEARALLRYFRDAIVLQQRVTNHYPLDLDRAALADQDTIPWTDFEVAPSEVPSWLVLQHFWYWRATRDTALIREHWPLMELCLKRPQRDDDILMTFGGGERWLHGALYDLFPDRVGDANYFIADDPKRGRTTYSFASSVLFMMSVHATAELVDALDRDANPDRWIGTPPTVKPGQRYSDRALTLMRDIEKHFYLEEEQFFAPAISRVTGRPHRSPFANANFLPLWVGWTFPTGEKSRNNLTHSMARLWRDGHRFGSTPNVGHTTGDVQGMLLFGLSDRDAHSRLECLDALVDMAAPAGEWGELHDPDGRPVASQDPDWPNRLDPQTSGLNLDALLFALSGVRYNALAHWDIDDIRLKPRIPNGATFVTMKGIAKDQRELNLFMSEAWRHMDTEERQKNASLIPEKQRDPDIEHRRMHFRVEQVSDDPARGYWDASIDCMDYIFVRYLHKQQPIHEAPYWKKDDNFFMPTNPTPYQPDHTLLHGDPTDTLVFTASPAARSLFGPNASLIDTGTPARPADFAALLLTDDGKPTAKLILHDGWNATDRTTFKTDSFWQDEAWTRAFDAFLAAGGSYTQSGKPK